MGIFILNIALSIFGTIRFDLIGYWLLFFYALTLLGIFRIIETVNDYNYAKEIEE